MMIIFYHYVQTPNNFWYRYRLKIESLFSNPLWHDLPNQRRAYILGPEREHILAMLGHVEPDRGPAVVLGRTPKRLRGKRVWSPIFTIHTMGFGNGRVTSPICHFPHTAHVQGWTMVRPSHQTTSLLSLLKSNMAEVVLFYLVKHLGSIFFLIYSAFIFIYKWVLVNLIPEIEVWTMFILKIN